jgi:hypothetical protein
MTNVQREVADHAGSNARKLSNPSTAGFLVHGELTMNRNNRVVAGAPSFLVSSHALVAPKSSIAALGRSFMFRYLGYLDSRITFVFYDNKNNG